MNRFIIAEPQKCIGCRTCEIACAVAHHHPATSISPSTFYPRLTILKGASISTAVMCRQCDDAPCLNVCPTGALIRAKESIQIVEEKCIGCKTCVISCPFGAIDIVLHGDTKEGKGLHAQVIKCDLCTHQADGPSCIKVCPTEALQLVDARQISASIQKKQQRAAFDEAAAMQFPG